MLTFSLILTFISLISAQSLSDVVTLWNSQALDMVKKTKIPPPRVGRNLAITHLAVYDAMLAVVNQQVERNPWTPYLVASNSTLTPRTTDQLEAVVHTAAYTVLSGLNWIAGNNAAIVDAQFQALTDLYNSKISALNTTSVQRSRSKARALTMAITWGQIVAKAHLAARKDDGSSIAQATLYSFNGLTAGIWRAVTPNDPLTQPLLPGWGNVVPFAMDSAQNFVPPAATSLNVDTPEYSAQVFETYSVGNVSKIVNGQAVLRDGTSESDQIADFWAGGGGTVTPPGIWNVIAQQVLKDALASPVSSWSDADSLVSLAKQLDEKLKNKEVVSSSKVTAGLATARVYAILNSALADAAILCWKTKYIYNGWRPLSAIGELVTDSSYAARVQGDLANVAATDSYISSWRPYLNTPNFPEYTSGHSTFSGSASGALSLLFPNFYSSQKPLKATIDSFIGNTAEAVVVTRQWNSFTDAASEAGYSRIYGGIHFTSANLNGLSSGAKIGQAAVKKFTIASGSSKKELKAALKQAGVSDDVVAAIPDVSSSTVPGQVVSELAKNVQAAKSQQWKQAEQVPDLEWD